MYRTGDLSVEKAVLDWRQDGDRVTGPVVVLPHSCEEWVIGGEPAVRDLVRDLQQILHERPLATREGTHE